MIFECLFFVEKIWTFGSKGSCFFAGVSSLPYFSWKCFFDIFLSCGSGLLLVSRIVHEREVKWKGGNLFMDDPTYWMSNKNWLCLQKKFKLTRHNSLKSSHYKTLISLQSQIWNKVICFSSWTFHFILNSLQFVFQYCCKWLLSTFFFSIKFGLFFGHRLFMDGRFRNVVVIYLGS